MLVTVKANCVWIYPAQNREGGPRRRFAMPFGRFDVSRAVKIRPKQHGKRLCGSSSVSGRVKLKAHCFTIFLWSGFLHTCSVVCIDASSVCLTTQCHATCVYTRKCAFLRLFTDLIWVGSYIKMVPELIMCLLSHVQHMYTVHIRCIHTDKTLNAPVKKHQNCPFKTHTHIHTSTHTLNTSNTRKQHTSTPRFGVKNLAPTLFKKPQETRLSDAVQVRHSRYSSGQNTHGWSKVIRIMDTCAYHVQKRFKKLIMAGR